MSPTGSNRGPRAVCILSPSTHILSNVTKHILNDRYATQNSVVLVTFFTLAVTVVVGVGPAEGMSEYLPYDLDA